MHYHFTTIYLLASKCGDSLEVGCRKKQSLYLWGPLPAHHLHSNLSCGGTKKKKNDPPSLRVSGTRCTVRFDVYDANEVCDKSELKSNLAGTMP